ncbi:MAG: hypothetical protein KF905_05640 [Flavobacteriales bacterium]|nr:hypothetical protein [Flavobacteriales bacterium]
MASKSFQTRRSWHNTQLVLLVTPPVLLVMVLVFAATGKADPLVWSGGVALAALLVALLRDGSNRSVYRMQDGRMILSDRKGSFEVRLQEISDASLIDRAAARDYIRAKLREQGFTGSDRRDRQRAFTRFCSVDIGLTSFTLGLGRSMIDRMPDARRDLVLLRLKGGEDLLLSPQYNQDLVAAVNRMVHPIS